jgi:anti-sigma regulatory factor (Ser/Thr protein kinase)
VGRVTAGGGATHAVAVYDSGEDLQRRVLPFLRAGLAGGESVIAVVSGPAADALGAGLGADRHDVQWQVPGVSYRSLGPMFDGLRRYLSGQRDAGRRVRLVAENDTGGNGGRNEAYLRFEAASNDVLGSSGFPWACLYDRHRFPPATLEKITQVHPFLLDQAGRTTASPGFVTPDAYLAAHPGPLSAVPPRPALDCRLTGTAQLPTTRHAAVEAARGFGLLPEDSDDFELAAAEVLSNALRHGERPVRLRLWGTSSHVVLRVDDEGAGDDLATKGFRPPDPRQGHLGGMGVWMVRQLADVVHVATGAGGTAVELQFRRTQPG